MDTLLQLIIEMGLVVPTQMRLNDEQEVPVSDAALDMMVTIVALQNNAQFGLCATAIGISDDGRVEAMLVTGEEPSRQVQVQAYDRSYDPIRDGNWEGCQINDQFAAWIRSDFWGGT